MASSCCRGAFPLSAPALALAGALQQAHELFPQVLMLGSNSENLIVKLVTHSCFDLFLLNNVA